MHFRTGGLLPRLLPARLLSPATGIESLLFPNVPFGSQLHAPLKVSARLDLDIRNKRHVPAFGMEALESRDRWSFEDGEFPLKPVGQVQGVPSVEYERLALAGAADVGLCPQSIYGLSASYVPC